MNLEEYKIELLSDFEELINFYTGKDKMDDFLHNHLQDCEESHYCKTFCVRLKANNTIVAIFALALTLLTLIQMILMICVWGQQEPICQQ